MEQVLLENLIVIQLVKIIRLLCKQMVQFHVHKKPATSPILRQRNPAHIVTHCFFKIHANINLLSSPSSVNWCPAFNIPE